VSTPEQSSSDQTTSDQTAEDQTTEDRAAEEQTTPEQPASEQTAPEQSVEVEAEETVSVPEPEVQAPIVPAATPNRLVQTVGRRKEAIVRVRLVPGSGVFKLNGRELAEYFPNKVHQQLVKDPLVTLEKAESYDVLASLRGGGISGQAGALRLAIARALIQINVDDRPAMKSAGFLTRDARAKERKKYGLKKARKAPQYSKR
jgi:small subunit ribosomal protein S9